MNRTRWSCTAAVIMGLAIAAVTALVEAQASRNASPVQFSLTGITADQTARLSVSAIDVGRGPAQACRATLTFVDPQGQTLLNSDGRPIEKHVALRPGESNFLEVQLGARATARLDLRPVVVDDGGACLPQLEIIDNATHSTLVVNPGIAVGGFSNHSETIVRDVE